MHCNIQWFNFIDNYLKIFLLTLFSFIFLSQLFLDNCMNVRQKLKIFFKKDNRKSIFKNICQSYFMRNQKLDETNYMLPLLIHANGVIINCKGGWITIKKFYIVVQIINRVFELDSHLKDFFVCFYLLFLFLFFLC